MSGADRVSIGYMAPSQIADPAESADMAVLAEDLGFDSVFIADQFQPWRTVGHSSAIVPWLGFVGARTRKIHLGVNAMVASRRRAPSIIAQEFATLACLLPGRVSLALGTGDGHDDIAATGRRWPAELKRVQRLRESVEIVRGLWRGERVTYRGESFRVHDAQLHDLPATTVPLLVTATSEAEARLAGELGDGMVCSSGFGLRAHRDQFVTTARSAARKPRALNLVLEVRLSYDPNPRLAAKSARPWLPAHVVDDDRYAPALFDATRGTMQGQKDTRWIVASSPDKVVQSLRQFVSLGYRTLVFNSPLNDQERFLRSFASDVMPALASARLIRPGEVSSPRRPAGHRRVRG